MAQKLFFGEETTSSTLPSGNITNSVASAWSSAYNGVIDRIRIYSTVSSGGLGIYLYGGSARNDAAGNLLFSSGSETVSNTGWNNYDLSTPIGINTSDVYRLGISQGVSNIRTAVSTGQNLLVNGSFNYASYTPPDPWGSGWTDLTTTYTNLYSAYGWEAPVVSSIDDSAILHGNPYVLTGTDFMDPSDTLVVEICNNSNYSAATVKTAQTVTAHDDTSADFTAVTTGLSGQAWVFVTTDLGQINAVGLEVAVPRTVYAFIKRADGVIMPTGKAILLS